MLIAKLLVVCRLLHKTLSQNETAPLFLRDLHSQLISLRRTLLRRTDKRLASANSTPDDVIEALSAYCLATSSSSDDAVAHFQQLRLEAIGNQLETTDLSGENVLKALRLYIRTLQTSKIILSRRLSDALGKLKARPLLSDPAVCTLEGLGIDVLGRWVAPDISNFTPWIKIGELTKPEAEKVTKQWSTPAIEAFTKGCQSSLAGWTDFAELLSLRRRTLETWLEFWSSTPTHSSLSVLESIRTIFNAQLTRILANEAKKLEYFGQRASSTISDWESNEHANVQSLWDQGLISMDYSSGGAAFRQTVVDRLLGRNEDISTISKDYQQWISSIETSSELIDEMRRAKWIDVFDESEEDLDVDIPAMLNDDDPRVLSDSLQRAVRDAFESLQSSFSDTSSSFGSSNQSAKAAFILRLIRQVRREIPSAYIPPDFSFSSGIVPKLQEALATEVSSNAGSFILPTDKKAKLPGRSLWEGDPELPVQPSPSAFKFLRRLMGSMDSRGPDLWDPSTVQVLKEILQKEVFASISSALEKLDSSDTTAKESTPAEEADSNETQAPETTGPKPEEESNARDHKLQIFFDAVYLRSALTAKSQSAAQNQVTGILERVRDSLGSASESETSRMEKSAAEYWARTMLLFGLLGGDLAE